MTVTWGSMNDGRNYTDEELKAFKEKHGITDVAPEWEQLMADAKKRIAERNGTVAKKES